MSIPQIVRIDPRDLDKNIAVGVSIPFNGSGVFNNTFSTKDQIKSNLINLLLTYKGERVENPEFGADLPRLLFEQIDDDLFNRIQNQIIGSVRKYIPEISILGVEINPDTDNNTINIKIDYRLNISGQQDNIIIELQ
jgi:phage baseplate assembly protein W